MAIGRVLQEEILDRLPPEDPSAQRSRRDLRRLNALMGNSAWMRASLAMAQPGKIAELGAGEGLLSRKIIQWQPHSEVVGLDLLPRPVDLPATISWRQGNLFEEFPGADTVVGCMIIHHFSDEKLHTLGRLLQTSRAIYFCEPHRAALPHFWARCMFPFVGEVTRHDMPASIDAGFIPGELPSLLSLKDWRVEETTDIRGTIRLRAWKE
jgi:hypothetical protein